LLLKGLVEELSVELGCTLSLSVSEASADTTGSLLHPYRRAAIFRAGQPVGVLGEVSPLQVQAMGLKKARPCYLELDLSALGLRSDMGTYQPPSLRPLSTRSLAFSLAPQVRAAEVLAVMMSVAPDWLESIDITDQFIHQEEGQPMRALTFAIRYRNDDSERSTEVLNQATEGLAEAVISALGSRGLTQRS
jgi:phenylalanyl-tRNA synthetase beta subunit